ncbi:MAG: C1 family peptidase [Chloroflexota bacterium]|nr:C1 family peptidase [Chloroflexota bacterium]
MKGTTILSILIILSMAQLTAAASDETERILQIRDAIADAGANWTAGPTSVSGRTTSEKQLQALSCTVPTPIKAPVTFPKGVRHDAAFDWRDNNGKNWVTPVRSQGSCGSCWAFSAIGAVESAVLIYTEDPDKDIDLSEQHLVSDCCSAGGCNGGWPDWALDYIRDTGVPDEVCYPYTHKDTACDPCAGWQDRAWKITGHEYVKPSEHDFKSALQEYGPISVVVTVPSDWYYYRTGVYTPVLGVGWANHAILLVGWDDSDDCWIIKNSWGQGWGESGYARVKYGDLEKYNYAYAVTGIVSHGAAPDIGGWMKPVSAVASSEYSAKYATEKAIDNKTSTYWFSKYREEDKQITFDLGELRTIDRVRMMVFYKDVPMKVDISVSGDSRAWRTVASDFEILDGSEYVEIPFSTCRCQYVRLTETEVHRRYGTCTELEVFCTEEEEGDDDYNMTLTLHYNSRPDRIIPIDEAGLIGILLSQNDTLWELWNI